MLESVFANYLVGQPPCDLVTLDVLLNPSDYAFALQKGSSLTKKDKPSHDSVEGRRCDGQTLPEVVEKQM